MLLVDVGNDGDRAMKLMALIEEASNKAPEAPKETAVEETYEGVKLIHMRPADDKAAKSDERHDTYGVAGDVFILCNSDDAVKRTVSFLKAPPEKSLATTAAYQAVLEKLSPEADVLAFGNIAQVIALAQKHAADPNGGQDPQLPQTLDALGLTGLGGVGLSVTIGPDFETVRAFAQTVGERKGIVKILTPAPGELHSGAEAPADAVTFMSVRFDPAGIFEEIQKILAVMSPQALAVLNAQMDAMSKQLGQPFDLRNDVLSVFGPRLAAYSRYEQPAQPDAKQQVIFMVDIVNKAAFNGNVGQAEQGRAADLRAVPAARVPRAADVRARAAGPAATAAGRPADAGVRGDRPRVHLLAERRGAAGAPAADERRRPDAARPAGFPGSAQDRSPPTGA